MATSIQRRHMLGLMDMLVHHEPLVHYRQARPMSTQHLMERDLELMFAAKRGIQMDCSESVTLICRLAGLLDPNGQHYNGYGFTGTILQHLDHYSDPADASVGALVVFGPGTGNHVAMVHTPGRNPLLFSHGSEAGPGLVRLEAEAHGQRPPVRFCSIAKL